MMKKIGFLLMMCVFIFVFVVCMVIKDLGVESEKKSSIVKEDGKVFYMNNGVEFMFFDLFIGFDLYLWNMFNNLMEGLICLGKSDEFEGVMVEKWDIFEDKKVYMFYL